MHWAALHAEQAGTPESVFELGLAVATMLKQPRATVVAELTRRYGTGLPDVLLLLDLPAQLAIERLRARGDAQGELHEQAPMLEQLRRLYHDVAAYLTARAPRDGDVRDRRGIVGQRRRHAARGDAAGRHDRVKAAVRAGPRSVRSCSAR